MTGSFWQKRKVYPSITTTRGSNWQEKIEEIRQLKLKEVCLFLTCLKGKERKELYKLLEKTEIKKIPLVHIRSDMKVEELDYLREKYNVGAFNTHSEKIHPFEYDLSKYIKRLYIENAEIPFNEEEIKKFGGICLDISHLENNRFINSDIYKNDVKIIEKYFCGCNHISAIKKNPVENSYKYTGYDFHSFDSLSEFDYLKKYPAKYFSPVLALELKNSIKEQITACDYIVKLFGH